MTSNGDLTSMINRELANALALSLNYRKYHWEVAGPFFRDLHQMFEEFYNDVDGTVDELAERVRQLGDLPIHTPEQIREFASIEIAEPGRMSPTAMVTQAHENSQRMIEGQRRGIKLAEQHDDPSTADKLTQYIQLHEKHEWFLRELLESDPRLDG